MYRCMHGVPALEWNDEMYDSVENYFGKASEMSHSDCYGEDAGAGGPAGENLYWAKPARSPMDAVDAWYDEISACGPFPGC